MPVVQAISPEQYKAIIAKLESIHFFDLAENQGMAAEDAPETHLAVTRNAQTKTVRFGEQRAPAALYALRDEIEKLTGVDEWIRQMRSGR